MARPKAILSQPVQRRWGGQALQSEQAGNGDHRTMGVERSKTLQSSEDLGMGKYANEKSKHAGMLWVCCGIKGTGVRCRHLRTLGSSESNHTGRAWCQVIPRKEQKGEGCPLEPRFLLLITLSAHQTSLSLYCLIGCSAFY